MNHYWRSIPLPGRVKVIVSAEGKEYKRQVAMECLVQKAVRFGAARIRYVAKAYPPDGLTRDLGNLTKALDDSLKYAGVFNDDEQIDDFRVIRQPVVRGGRIEIELSAL